MTPVYSLKSMLALGCAAALLPLLLFAQADDAVELGFFITSEGPGNGGDLGGLAGADAHCQALAEAAGAGHRSWRAYLSTQVTDGVPAVNARDRIGEGPWANANGAIIGASVDDLHYNNANIDYDHALDENGNRVNSGANDDSPNRHDILTGTQLDGTAFPPGASTPRRTCWRTPTMPRARPSSKWRTNTSAG